MTNELPDFISDEQIDRYTTPDFISDDEIDNQPYLGETFLKRLPQSFGNMAYESVATPLQTVARYPSAFYNVMLKNQNTNPLLNLLEAGKDAFKSASLRNVPDTQKAQAWEEVQGGIGGGAIGSALGTAIAPGVGTFIGGLAGGVGLPWLMNQRAQLVGKSPDTPIGQDIETGLADLFAGGAFPSALKYGSRGLARTVTNPLARSGAKLVAASKRLNDPNELRAAALSTTSTDQAIRPPRRSIEIPLQQKPEIVITNYDRLKTSSLDGESSLRLDNQPDGSLPSTEIRQTLPDTEIVSDVKEAPLSQGALNVDIQGDTTTGTSQRRTPQSYWLKDSVKEVPEFFEYPRNLSEPEFPQLLQNIQQKTSDYNARLDSLLDSLPPEASQPIGKAVFGDIINQVEGDLPYSAEKPFRDVLALELKFFGANKLPIEEAIEFRRLASQKISELKGTGNSLSEAQNALLNDLGDKIIKTTLNPIDMRRLKTEFDKLGKWHINDTGEYSMRKDAYREIANSLRNTLEETVAQYAPDKIKDYQMLNRKLYLGSKYTKLATDRVAQQMGEGRLFADESLLPKTEGEIPIVSPFYRWALNKMYPQMRSPEQRLIAADSNTFNFGRGGAPKALQPGYIAGSAMQGAGEAGTGALGAVNASPAFRSAITGGTQQIGNDSTSTAQQVQNFLSKQGGRLNNILKVLSPSEAQAQELGSLQPQQPAPLPRDTERFKSDAVMEFLMRASQTPQAPIAQELVKKLQQAFQAQDMDTAEKIHSDMARLFPDMFEQGLGVNGKIFYPDEQAKYMDKLKQLHRMGVVDSIHLSKQQNSFNNSQDSRVLPVTPQQPRLLKSNSTFYNGSRVYDY